MGSENTPATATFDDLGRKVCHAGRMRLIGHRPANRRFRDFWIQITGPALDWQASSDRSAIRIAARWPKQN